MALRDLLHNLPEVKSPVESKVSFNVKLKWTLVILVAFFVLANIPLFGITESALSRFEFLAVLLGTSFGSIISLGIGPIVMASIILQLLVGAQILNIDTNSEEGKKFFQGLQKLLAFAFVIFEAIVYVLMKGIAAEPGFTGLVILQVCLGGFLIIFMDEVIQKWGFGSGVSLFIAGGIGWRLFAQLFQFIGPQGTFEASGKVLALVASVIVGDGTGAARAIFPIIVTAVLFLAVVFAQSLKVEIPLAYDRVRGHGVKWPLQFFYAGVIPVILVSALAANLQLFSSLLQNWLGGATFLGGFVNGQPISGLAYWIHSTPLLETVITGSFRWVFALQAVGHVLFYTLFSILFAFFWVNTSGQDARSQAGKIMSSGMSMPGFRKDERVLESILKRYVTPLTIMGGAAIGLLASVANLLGALVGGTAILLAVMIIYQLYQNIAQQHAVDMNPALRGFFGG
ncbi:preprotein translocase subunit SecY [archaeon]|jgi:preprotein translocase subunit SecY|nr:preprotein translocase subunit SecY [archaeon]MBT3578272.1 preprotein translocase subunit SecY [archaeon]MBT6819807.1 preprotein translocase subunit SecY [archaeon]MBT7025589.1 preprotein translocase subunit SecY [archaeon]MBT7239097.1 preprotein translocase subunit SecY [archaeon]